MFHQLEFSQKFLDPPFRCMEKIEGLVHAGFRPANLPAKSMREKERHQAHVSSVLSRRSLTFAPVSCSERAALDTLWRTELLVGKELVLTEQMRRLWRESGLPSSFVRSILWPFVAAEGGKVKVVASRTVGASLTVETDIHPQTDAQSPAQPSTPISPFTSIIALDVARTLPHLSLALSTSVCVALLEAFAAAHPAVGYTQGMSYVCARLMVDLGSDFKKTMVCLNRLLLGSPTVACMYRLDVSRTSVEFLLDSIAWDNVPRLWLELKGLVNPLDWFFLDWVLTLFSKSFNLRISGFVIDQLLLDGDVAIYRAAVAALLILEQPILALKPAASLEQVGEIFAHAHAHVFDLATFTKAFHEVHLSEEVSGLIRTGFHK